MSGPGAIHPRSPSASPRVVAIGNFDGVHRGHQAVLERAARIAASSNARLAVLTFDPHPRQVLLGQRLPVLTTRERKVRLLEDLGLGIEVLVLPFTKDLAEQSPEEFCRRVLVERLAATHVLVGSNFRFGKNRVGDLPRLVELGKEFGFGAGAESLFGDEEGAFSSTRVRKLLAEGAVAEAAEVLGRPHLISGTVLHGDQRGRTLGFPTANLGEVPETLPAEGVYAVRVFEGRSGTFLRDGALNLGARPTVERPDSTEVHLFDFEGDLYGQQLAVELLDRVRPVQRFAGLPELKDQIARDVARARQLCERAPRLDRAPGWASSADSIPNATRGSLAAHKGPSVDEA